MIRFWTIILWLVPMISLAQMVRLDPYAEETELPGFDATFIARNGIRSIVGVPAVKRDNEPIRDQSHRYLYRFDIHGRLIYSNTSYGRPGTGTDTASVVQTFDVDGHLKQRLRNELNGFFAIELEYDDKQRVVRNTHVGIANEGRDRYHFSPGARTVISDETFTYTTRHDTIHIRTSHNNLGLPYREELSTYDRLGYLRRVEDRYPTSGRRAEMDFRYDEHGRLRERLVTPDVKRDDRTRQLHLYDEAGNLLSTNVYHNGVHVRRDEYLYDENTSMLKARLSKDMGTSMITIVRYTIER